MRHNTLGSLLSLVCNMSSAARDTASNVSTKEKHHTYGNSVIVNELEAVCDINCIEKYNNTAATCSAAVIERDPLPHVTTALQTETHPKLLSLTYSLLSGAQRGAESSVMLKVSAGEYATPCHTSQSNTSKH